MRKLRDMPTPAHFQDGRAIKQQHGLNLNKGVSLKINLITTWRHSNV